ncbi:MAG: hypothetical protein A3F54_04155 [Candidatus Kerfeldbacteria bacterium RIFCSPHIGHO2_12_FULL_48_17]|uniref:Uncharacterized protein n=1 Tax=Candidatus Kerfeldbacteria bacterium RIFCSPHIGHO2_12_FULL_48_17 TaxID=1798542 RepID=A0A1G2B9G1_9BACT|nr:MAG: hypothetical protein A3F54_04155 [Candidatus Kerfeldbacteria bacterium RIFCSPHIGHO2_12_FULL_48_17]
MLVAASYEQDRNLSKGFLTQSFVDRFDSGNIVDSLQFRTLPYITVEDVWGMVSKYHLTLVRIETDYMMGDREWFDTVYSPQARSSQELYEEIIQARREIWGNICKEDPLSSDEETQYQAGIDFLQMADDEIDAPQIFSVFLAGTRPGLRAAVNTLAQDQDVPYLSEVINQFLMNDEPPPVTTAAAPDKEKWLPEDGSVVTGPSSTSGYRYVTQTLRWDDKSGFAASGHYSTYEHEFFLYNYTGGSYQAGTYLSAASTAWPACYPNLKSSSHNYPASAYAYLDTRLTYKGSCPSSFNEVEFTHGLVFASKISAWTNYKVTMTVANGNTSTDEFKLQGDIGYCTSSASTCAANLTWGVYSENLHERIEPDSSGVWNKTVPGTKYWTE